MKLKTERELTAFMLGIEAGRIFKMHHSGTNACCTFFENFDDDGVIAVYLSDGRIYYDSPEAESVDGQEDYRHEALMGMHIRAKRDAKRAFEFYKAKQAEKATEGQK